MRICIRPIVNYFEFKIYKFLWRLRKLTIGKVLNSLKPLPQIPSAQLFAALERVAAPWHPLL